MIVHVDNQSFLRLRTVQSGKVFRHEWRTACGNCGAVYRVTSEDADLPIPIKACRTCRGRAGA